MNNNRTPEQEKRAEENAKLTAEALELAAQHRARESNGVPLVQSLADSIKSKLEVLPPEEN